MHVSSAQISEKEGEIIVEFFENSNFSMYLLSFSKAAKATEKRIKIAMCMKFHSFSGEFLAKNNADIPSEAITSYSMDNAINVNPENSLPHITLVRCINFTGSSSF
jgi:hypothetical protein